MFIVPIMLKEKTIGQHLYFCTVLCNVSEFKQIKNNNLCDNLNLTQLIVAPTRLNTNHPEHGSLLDLILINRPQD